MPLIYGKTAYAFADDLVEFFTEGHMHPSRGALRTLASQIIQKLNNDPVFNSVNLFMKAMRVYSRDVI